VKPLLPGGGGGWGAPVLIAFCRTVEQLEAALAEGVREIELEFEDIRAYREAVARAGGARVAVAPPRIHKPGETAILKRVFESGAPAVLVRNLAHVDFFRGRMALVGDFSLNVANDLTADWLLGRGLERFVPSYDLNAAQLEALLERTDPGRVEVTVHQHMPLFHLEHCVFAACLSKGHDATDCGRPCDRHRVSLRDRTGREHPLGADVGCRNTVFNATPQSASAYVAGWRARGVGWFRVELLREDGPAATALLRPYRALLEGAVDGAELWRRLRASSTFGVTRGPLAEEL
jgi:putative protease